MSKENKRKAKSGDKHYRVDHCGELTYYTITKNRTLCRWDKYEKKWYVYPYSTFNKAEVVSIFVSAREITREHMLYMGFLEE